MREKPKSIYDNARPETALAACLRPRLAEAEVFRLVSAYFSVFGFGALADELENPALRQTKFLFGAPSSAGETALGEKPRRRFDFSEDGLTVEEGVLQQSALAKRCAAWVNSGKVQVRAVKPGKFLHGKMYHMESPNGGAATVGSSNFTRRGLGLSSNSNLEMNLAVRDAETRAELAEWFDELWNDKTRVADAKQDMLEALARWHEEYPPEFVYYKTLLELFRKDMETRLQGDKLLGDSHLYDSVIWKKLYEFQKDGAKSVINRLLRHNGCILADSVGLGKTYTALAAIKFFELQNKNVLVLCPKKLENNWRIYQAAAGDINNPLAGDRFAYSLLAHTDLTRASGMSGNVNLETFNWGNFDLVVIDESHNFRNDSKSRRDEDGAVVRHSRYEKLLEDVIKSGVETKVLMLSATPVNTSLTDLQNQIYLMTEKREDAFAESLGIRNIKNIVKAAQQKFKEWEYASENKDKLLEMLGGDFFHLLGNITIARSRRQIRKFYAGFIAEQGDFPKREKPQNEAPPADQKGELSGKELFGDVMRLQFHIYRPSNYITSGKVEERLAWEKKNRNFNQKDREGFLVAMMCINFMKRLESSACALRLTLERTLDKIETQIGRIDKYLSQPDDNAQTEAVPGSDEYEEDEDFIVNHKAMSPYRLRELDVKKWRADMQKDQKALKDALAKVQKITPARDGKLLLLKKQLRQKAKKPNRKLLVFTSFKDTAAYLYENLRECAGELGINLAMVAGSETKTECGANTFSGILDSFAPKARGKSGGGAEIDLLIATDCISEGQNLQDCDTVLNYDIHWNPVRLIQRFGRIDRIGSKNKSVRMINYWPTGDIDFYLQLENRVRARMALVDAAATGDDNSLDEAALNKTAQKELNFRDLQTKAMRKDIKDFEELNNSVSISDFTLDYFLAQLARYLQANRDALDAAPPGIYAVADCADGGLQKESVRPGAIFFFRQKDAGENRIGNPVHPFYFVHAQPDKIACGYMHPRKILNVFEALAAGKSAPLTALCDSFSREISKPEGLQQYGDMANAALADIQAAFNKNAGSGIGMGQGRNARLPADSEKPGADNLQLITWLVIKEKTR